MTVVVCIIAFFLAHIAGSCCGITVCPAEDVVIAENSSENVTYTCEVAVSLPEGVILRWEIRGEQIWSASQVKRYADSGVFIESDEKTLSLVVTPRGRRELHAHSEPITVSCSSYDVRAFKIIEASEELQIHQFGAPGPVVGLELMFHSDTEVRLQWSRPADSHPDVSTTYVVNITNNANDTLTLSNETHVLVSQRGNEICQPHSFSVTAMNDAGSGPVSTIMDSIPISPSVDVITESQRVDRVLLTEDGAVNITLSFPHAEGCGESYPVVNYTVDIAGSRLELSAGDYSGAVIFVTISSHEMPAITRGQRYSVVIGACNQFTCRSSNMPLTVVTGDVQAVSVMFYMRSVVVDCTLTEGSPAIGCLAVFTRYSDSGTENVTTTSGICPQLTQTRGAYEDKVVIYSIGPDRSTVYQPITASVVDAMTSDNLTCRIPEPTVLPTSTLDKSEGGALSARKIAGISIGVVAALAIAAAAAVLIAVAITHRRITTAYKNWVHKMTEDEGIDLMMNDDDRGKPTIKMLMNLTPRPEVSVSKKNSLTRVREQPDLAMTTSKPNSEDEIALKPRAAAEPTSPPPLSGKEPVAAIKMKDSSEPNALKLLLKPAVLAHAVNVWKTKVNRGSEMLLYWKEVEEDVVDDDEPYYSDPEDI